jgi:hypothetical protein
MSKNSSEDQLSFIKVILKWIKVASVPQVKKVLETALKDDQKRLGYHLSTGLTSSKIASKVSVSFRTVAAWWTRWYKLGIAEKIPVKKGERRVKSFDLRDFGIPIPKDLKAKSTESSPIQHRQGEQKND